tara:strand:+ start:371 stop:610 length:240 start_codon:yes stop_codon:yes gene_type:complete
MTVYTATFTTQRGEQRVMNFIRPSEAPKDVFPTFFKERKLQPGYETVWDIDRQQYRTFNNNTVIGSVSSNSRDVMVELF